MHEILGFIWPIMAASAEGMIFLWIIVILVIIGRGKILPSEKTITIDRNGRYKMELAPGLNLAQPFIEAIAEQISLREDINENGMLSFKVQDKNIASRKQPFYLLQVSMQNRYLSFNARPVLYDAMLPSTTPLIYNDKTMSVENAIHAVAKSWGIGLQTLGEAS
jgi:hypothetical protein